MRFEKDEMVYAKWPGSGGKFFLAKILKVFEEDEVYKVAFDADGTKMNMDTGSVMSVQDAEKKQSAAARRRSRSRSPARRRSMSPARTKGMPKIKQQEQSTHAPRARALISSVSSTSSNEEVKVKRLSYSSEEDAAVSRRRSVRLQNLDSMDNTQTSSTVTKTTTFSRSSHKAQQDNSAIDFLWTILFNVFALIGIGCLIELPLYLLHFCNKNSCDIVYDRAAIISSIPRELSAYYNWQAFVAFNGFLLFQAILHALPIGEIKTPIKQMIQYRINVFPAFCATILIYCTMMYLKWPVAKFVYDNLFQLTSIATVEITLLSLLLYFASYIRADKISPYATGVMFPDVLIGRMLHPRIGSLFDLKLFMSQTMWNIAILLNLMYLQLELDTRKNIRPVMLFVTVSQILSLLINFIGTEDDRFISGYDMRKCGAGMAHFMKLSFLTVATFPAKYIYEHPNLANPTNFMAAAMAITCLVGMTIRHLSNRQKHMFRVSPYDPRLAGLESIRSPSGQRLLVSGFWGLLRRPSYLGEILISVSWSLTCGCDHYMVWIYPLILFLVLVQRTLQDEKYCSAKHGHAWDEYCKRVPYRLIPFVF